jgi:trehalose/maltose hydrolase-like predicted phosphorylase
MADTKDSNTIEGVQLGAKAGTVDVLQRCYNGLETRIAAHNFDPVLPSTSSRAFASPSHIVVTSSMSWLVTAR